jgi:hypothetical protein
LTSYATGEEVLMDDLMDDDDEYTFVSCSDTESLMGNMSLQNFDEDMLEELNSSLASGCDLSTTFSSSFSSSFNNNNSSSSSSRVGRRSSGSRLILPSYNGSLPYGDFESRRNRLQRALENRNRKQGRHNFQKMDGLTRKLRYNLSRKMFKEQLLLFKKDGRTPPRSNYEAEPQCCDLDEPNERDRTTQVVEGRQEVMA